MPPAISITATKRARILLPIRTLAEAQHLETIPQPSLIEGVDLGDSGSEATTTVTIPGILILTEVTGVHRQVEIGNGTEIGRGGAQEGIGTKMRTITTPERGSGTEGTRKRISGSGMRQAVLEMSWVQEAGLQTKRRKPGQGLSENPKDRCASSHDKAEEELRFGRRGSVREKKQKAMRG